MKTTATKTLKIKYAPHIKPVIEPCICWPEGVAFDPDNGTPRCKCNPNTKG